MIPDPVLEVKRAPNARPGPPKRADTLELHTPPEEVARVFQALVVFGDLLGRVSI
jgi:hypothetical protein